VKIVLAREGDGNVWIPQENELELVLRNTTGYIHGARGLQRGVQEAESKGNEVTCGRRVRDKGNEEEGRDRGGTACVEHEVGRGVVTGTASYVFKGVVKVLEEFYPSGLLSGHFLRFTEILEIPCGW